MTREEKNKAISESIKQTRARRKSQIPLVFRLKIRNEKRNKKTGVFDRLKMVFVEGKWVYNAVLSEMNVNKRKISDIKDKEFKSVKHYDKDRNELVSDVTHLTSSMRLGVITGIKWSIAALKAKKKKGHKVGRLKYKSDLNTILLIQYGITHWLTGQNSIHIQGIDTDIRVAGLRQLRELEKNGIEYEYSMMKLIKEADDYYIDLTVYVDKEQYTDYKDKKRQKKLKEENRTLRHVNGIDMGLKTAIVDADGRTYDATVEESGRLKRLHRSQRRKLIAAGWNPKGGKQQKVERSNNWCRDRIRLRKEYVKLNRKRNAAAIEVCNDILLGTEVLVMQDEQITSWKKRRTYTGKDGTKTKKSFGGRKIQHSILGRVKARLESKPQVHVMNKWVPTTKLCTNCGKTFDDIRLGNRRYVCPHCGHDDGERDCHSAKVQVWLYENMPDRIGLDGAEFTRGDFD